MLPSIQQLHPRAERPVRVLQFGEGNFLRGFADYFIDIANERGQMDAGIAIAKPIPMGTLDAFHQQDCVYTVCLRGRVDGEPVERERVVTSVRDAVDCYAEYERYAAYAKLPTLRFVVSNTTEAGIVYDDDDRLDLCPPASYPGKLCKLLYERAEHFDYALDKGLIILPVELIDENGLRLRECVQRLAKRWALGERFERWLSESCVFASTLVDRIITGYPRAEEQAFWARLGYEDHLIVTGEPFALWVIESDRDISREFNMDGLPVLFTDDHRPYKQRKVRILNGAHTSFVLAAYLCGYDTVAQSMGDPMIRAFMEGVIFDEVIPTLTLPEADLRDFAAKVLDRFNNPFVRHALLSIALNSVSKWRARCLPSLKAYVAKNGALPPRLAFSLAALIAFYGGDELRDGALIAHRGGEEYKVLDDAGALAFFLQRHADAPDALAKAALSNADFWGEDLTLIPGLEARVAEDLSAIRDGGMRAAMEARRDA